MYGGPVPLSLGTRRADREWGTGKLSNLPKVSLRWRGDTALGPVDPPGPDGPKCGLTSPETGFLPQQDRAEPSAGGWDIRRSVSGADRQHQSASAAGPVRKVTRHVWQPFQGNSNKYCHYHSNPPTLVSLKFLPCDTVEKSKIFTIGLFTEKSYQVWLRQNEN